MEAKHKINERLKRLEPVDTLCQFCKKAHADKMDRNYFAPVFKEKDRTNVVVYRSVQFGKILIGIPRCTQCFVIHKKANYNSWLISITAAIALAVLGFFLLGALGVFVLILCLVGVFIAPMLVEDILVKKQGVLTEAEAKKQDATVQEFVLSGWSLHQPTA